MPKNKPVTTDIRKVKMRLFVRIEDREHEVLFDEQQQKHLTGFILELFRDKEIQVRDEESIISKGW